MAAAAVAVALVGVAFAPTSALPAPQGLLPNRALTPGQVDPKLDRDYLCTHSTSERRRVSDSKKRAVFAEYGWPYPGVDDREQWEVDHLVPLALGGTNDITNLWPERPFGDKDRLENELRRRVCAHTLDLATAQKAIATDWQAAYRRYVAAQ